MAPASASPGRHLLVPALLAAVVVAAFASALDIYISGDDFEWLEASYDIVRHPLSSFEPINHFFRPLVKWTYVADYLAFGREGIGYMLTNLAVHFLNVVLLWCLLRRRLGDPMLAPAAAAAFALSPLHSEAVLWAAGRPDTLLLACWLGSLLLLERWVEHSSPVSGLSAVGLALLGAGAKESWIVFPFLFTAYAVMVLRRTTGATARLTGALWIAWFAYLGVFLLRPALSSTPSAVHYADLRLLPALFKTSSTLLAYCGLERAVPDGWASLVVAALLLAGTAAVLLRSGGRFGQWALLWLAATLALVAPFPPDVLRHNYLPLVGFWMVAATLAERALGRHSLAGEKPARTGFRLAVVGVFAAVAAVEAGMLQLEIGDYRLYGDLHRRLCRSYADVEPAIPRDRPIVVVDRSSFRGVDYAADVVRGCDKTFFVRRDAIWQLVFLEPLANFMGRPFEERLERMDPASIDAAPSGVAVLLVDDSGFALRADLREAAAEAISSTGGLPPGVGLYRFTAE